MFKLTFIVKYQWAPIAERNFDIFDMPRTFCSEYCFYAQLPFWAIMNYDV